MADNTPKVNQIGVDVRLRLSDPTQGADNGLKLESTDFKIWSPEQINHLVNSAIRYVANKLASTMGVDWVALNAPGFKKSQSITFASGGTDLNADYMQWIRLNDSSNRRYEYFPSKADLDEQLDPYVDNAFIIEGNLLFAYRLTSGTWAQVTSGTATFYYIKADRKDSNGSDVGVNTTPDTTAEQKWHEAITVYACATGFKHKGNTVNYTELKAYGDSLLNEIMKPNVPA